MENVKGIFHFCQLFLYYIAENRYSLIDSVPFGILGFKIDSCYSCIDGESDWSSWLHRIEEFAHCSARKFIRK